MSESALFRLAVVPGVVIDRWVRTWIERRPAVRLELVPAEAAAAPGLMPEHADAGLVRLPVDTAALHAIPLYEETSVVLAPRKHLLTAAESLTLAEAEELGEPMLRPADDVLGLPYDRADYDTATAVELVAAETGLLVVPQSLARLHHRRDVVYRPLTDGPTSRVALAWPREGHTELVEEMIGIVRGRTVNSTRGQPAPPRPSAGARGGPGAGRGRPSRPRR